MLLVSVFCLCGPGDGILASCKDLCLSHAHSLVMAATLHMRSRVEFSTRNVTIGPKKLQSFGFGFGLLDLQSSALSSLGATYGVPLSSRGNQGACSASSLPEGHRHCLE